MCRRRRKSFSCVLLRLDKPSSEVFLYHSLRQHCESKSAALREGRSSSCLLVLRPTLFHSLRRLLPRDQGSKCKNFFCNRIKFTPRLSPVLFVRQLLRKIKLQCVEKYYLTRHCIITTRLSLLDQEQEKKTGKQTPYPLTPVLLPSINTKMRPIMSSYLNQNHIVSPFSMK